MNWPTKIKQRFERSLEIMHKSLEQARIAQKNAPSAAESHSDTTRSEMEKLVTALEIDIGKLKQKMSQIPVEVEPNPKGVQLWRHIKIDNGGQVMELILVPDGMGGGTIDNTRLVSVTTPLGMAIMGKYLGQVTSMAGREVKILQVE